MRRFLLSSLLFALYIIGRQLLDRMVELTFEAEGGILALLFYPLAAIYLWVYPLAPVWAFFYLLLAEREGKR